MQNNVTSIPSRWKAFTNHQEKSYMYFGRQYFIRIVLVIKASLTQFTIIAN